MSEIDISNWKGYESFSFQFSSDTQENEDIMAHGLERIATIVQTIFSETEKQSHVLSVCTELLTNTCDHVNEETRTAYLNIFFREKSILVEYGDSGDFFTRESVKVSLESRLPIASTRETGIGGVGMQMLVEYANRLWVKREANRLYALFE